VACMPSEVGEVYPWARASEGGRVVSGHVRRHGGVGRSPPAFPDDIECFPPRGMGPFGGGLGNRGTSVAVSILARRRRSHLQGRLRISRGLHVDHPSSRARLCHRPLGTAGLLSPSCAGSETDKHYLLERVVQAGRPARTRQGTLWGREPGGPDVRPRRPRHPSWGRARPTPTDEDHQHGRRPCPSRTADGPYLPTPAPRKRLGRVTFAPTAGTVGDGVPAA